VKRIVVLAALFCLPSVVHADQMRVTSYDMDDSGGIVRLESNTAVGEPWVRVDGKMVRVWFPHIVDIARFDHEREGDQPIKALALRPGASDTAVLRVDLGNARHITPSDVEITRNGPQVSVQIKVPLPKVATPAASEVTQPTRHAEPAPNAGKHSSLAAAEAPPTAAAAAPLAAKASTATTDVSAAKSSLMPAMADMPAELSKQSQPTLMYLMIASLVLAAILGALQYNNKRKPSAKPQIEVLGARRLGHRQELLIVRALGSDHLLLCTAGRAERVASSPTPMPSAPDSYSRGEESQAGGIGLMSRLSSHSRLRKLLDNVEHEAPADEEHNLPLTPKQNPFGAELFSAARKQAAIHSLPAPRKRQSEAVAGIDRLRKRAAT
jgi:hypothetical protein